MKEYTEEQWHQQFSNYLMEKLEMPEIADMVLKTAEMLPETLNDYFGMEIGSIYDLQDSEEIDNLRTRIMGNAVLKKIDMEREPRYTTVLKLYKKFLLKQNAMTQPLPVPGEQDREEKALADHEPPTVENTIYLEGEAGEQQCPEIRLRNKKLREVCIKHYRSLHGGRLVCECCGFEFARAYDIEEDYIEVHHRTPFSQTEGEHPVDATKDLVPLCANCHRMIHHGQGGNGNCMQLDELKKIYKGKRYL